MPRASRFPPHVPSGFAATPLPEVLGDGAFRFQMRLARGEASDFFAPGPEHASVVAQRRHWLTTAPGTHSGLLPGGEALVAEAAGLARSWHGFDASGSRSPLETCLALGEFWEADFMLLRTDAAGQTRLLGGCVCFPSSWDLREKLGQPIEIIHAPVPGLNASLGPAVGKFLAGLKPGPAWHRVNWGLSRSQELNQHPGRGLPRLDARVAATDVWLRVEEQALLALKGGILFGIRIVNHPLADVRNDRAVAARLAQALESMPEPVARYKGLLNARPRLIELLMDGSPGPPA